MYNLYLSSFNCSFFPLTTIHFNDEYDNLFYLDFILGHKDFVVHIDVHDMEMHLCKTYMAMHFSKIQMKCEEIKNWN